MQSFQTENREKHIHLLYVKHFAWHFMYGKCYITKVWLDSFEYSGCERIISCGIFHMSGLSAAWLKGRRKNTAFRMTSDLKQTPVLLSGVQCEIQSVWAVSAETLLLVSSWRPASHPPPLSFQFDTHFTFQRYSRSIPMLCSQKCKDRRQPYSKHFTRLYTLAGKHTLSVVMVVEAWSSTDSVVLALERSCGFFFCV